MKKPLPVTLEIRPTVGGVTQAAAEVVVKVKESL